LSAPLWVNTFTRHQFRFVLNDALVANLTAFHAIYPLIEDREYWLLLAALLNTAFVASRLQQQLRIYGSGLQKLEPLDVAALDVPDPERIPAMRRTEIVAWYQRRCATERTDVVSAKEAAQQIERLVVDLVGAN
jgi:adenine-specific DNA-methyltransferase